MAIWAMVFVTPLLAAEEVLQVLMAGSTQGGKHTLLALSQMTCDDFIRKLIATLLL